ncbi:hypothetical protein J6590_045389 [Homalodisca vitripennis]|nr:hypothetical protein J6590_045389 [Homalodisca vitripennis]
MSNILSYAHWVGTASTVVTTFCRGGARTGSTLSSIRHRQNKRFQLTTSTTVSRLRRTLRIPYRPSRTPEVRAHWIGRADPPPQKCPKVRSSRLSIGHAEGEVRAKKPSLTLPGDQRLKGDFRTTTNGRADEVLPRTGSLSGHPSKQQPRSTLLDSVTSR